MGHADKQEVALTKHTPPVCLSGLHAERPREGDRPAEDHGEGAGEEAASRHLHLRRRAQSQDQRPDQGHEQPAAGTDARYVPLPVGGAGEFSALCLNQNQQLSLEDAPLHLKETSLNKRWRETSAPPCSPPSHTHKSSSYEAAKSNTHSASHTHTHTHTHTHRDPGGPS